MENRKQKAIEVLKKRQEYGPTRFIGEAAAVIGGIDAQKLLDIPKNKTHVAINFAIQLLYGLLNNSSASSVSVGGKRVKIEEETSALTVRQVGTEEKESEIEAVDYYKTLGISNKATKEEIKKAHRKLIKEYHPDKLFSQNLSTKEMAEKTAVAQDINIAYSVLSNDKARKDYDTIIYSHASKDDSPPPLASTPQRVFITVPAPQEIAKSIPVTTAPPQTSTVTFETPSIPSGKIKATIKKRLFRKSGKSAVGQIGKSFGKKLAKKAVKGKIVGKIVGKIATALASELGPLAKAVGLVVEKATGYAIKKIKSSSKTLGKAFLTFVLLFPYLIASLFSTIISTIIIGLLVVGGLVAIILFIINTSAFVTPQGEGLSASTTTPGPIQSQYIRVTKTPSPAGPFQNDQTIEVTYSISIQATTEDLSNISINYTCVVTKANPNPGCPNIEPVDQSNPVTIPNLIGQTINAGESVSFSYKQTYQEPNFNDSRITDTIVVTADAESAIGEQSVATASVTIGTPPGPITCPKSGSDITAQFATRIPGGYINLLPEAIRNTGVCISPTMLVIHWSADGSGSGSPTGNDGLWNTFANTNGFGCQFGTDTDDSLILLPLYENQTEMPKCVGTWNGIPYNNYAVNIEMSGEWFGDVNGQGESYWPPTSTGPWNVNQSELDITYQTACEITRQYNISHNQIFGHYELNPPPDKYDPGEGFLHTIFIPTFNQKCPETQQSSG